MRRNAVDAHDRQSHCRSYSRRSVPFLPLPRWRSEAGHTQMETLSDTTRVSAAGCLFLGMTLPAVLVTLASVISRADTHSELVEGHIVNLVIVGPLWAVWVFVSLRRRGRSKTQALAFACAVYVLVASSLVALNIWKYNMRMSGRRTARNHQIMEVPALPASEKLYVGTQLPCEYSEEFVTNAGSGPLVHRMENRPAAVVRPDGGERLSGVAAIAAGMRAVATVSVHLQETGTCGKLGLA